jgi:hypothetical protein
MQDHIHRFTGLFDEHYIPIRREHAPMRALRHPIQLCGRQSLEQLDIRKQVARVVFLEFIHG